MHIGDCAEAGINSGAASVHLLLHDCSLRVTIHPLSDLTCAESPWPKSEWADHERETPTVTYRIIDRDPHLIEPPDLKEVPAETTRRSS